MQGKLRSRSFIGTVTLGVAVIWVAALARTSAQQRAGTVAIDNDDIGGVVTSTKGPEAGVWVIAETTDLPTRFAKIVVTDDRGRYLVPDLPKANYNVWVRGYGLVDSAPIKAKPNSTTLAQLALRGRIGLDQRQEDAPAQQRPQFDLHRQSRKSRHRGLAGPGRVADDQAIDGGARRKRPRVDLEIAGDGHGPVQAT